MKITTVSQDLLSFLQDVEVTSENPDKPEYYTEKFSIKTSEYAFSGYLLSTREKGAVLRCYGEIDSILSQQGHGCTRNIIISIIALFCLSPKAKRSRELVEIFFCLIHDTKIKQYLFFKAIKAAQIKPINFHDFSIGEINYKKLRDFIGQHSGSDYAIRYEKELTGRVGITMKHQNVRCLDFFSWLIVLNLNPSNISQYDQEIINLYLTEISNPLFSSFQKNFHDQQKFINALYGLTFNIDALLVHGFEFVNVFYSFKNSVKAGWVLPVHTSQTDVRFPDPRIVEEANSFIKSNSSFLIESKATYFRYLKSVSEFFANAELQIIQLRFSQAYVELFVGLDFLLAPDTEKSKKLKQRIAFLTYKKFDITFIDQLSKLDFLYDVRSNYIHNGVEVAEKDLTFLRNLARVVLWVLFQVHISNMKFTKMGYDEWIGEMDFLVQEFYKGVMPKQNQLIRIGIKELDGVHLSGSIDRYSDEILSKFRTSRG